MSGSSPFSSNQVLHFVCQFPKPNNSFKPTPLRGPANVLASSTTPCHYAARLNSGVRHAGLTSMRFQVLSIAALLALFGCAKTLSNEVEWTFDNSSTSKTKGEFYCKFSSSRICHVSIRDNSKKELLGIDVDSGTKAEIAVPDFAKSITVTAYSTDSAKEIDLFSAKFSQKSKTRFNPGTGSGA